MYVTAQQIVQNRARYNHGRLDKLFKDMQRVLTTIRENEFKDLLSLIHGSPATSNPETAVVELETKRCVEAATQRLLEQIRLLKPATMRVLEHFRSLFPCSLREERLFVYYQIWKELCLMEKDKREFYTRHAVWVLDDELERLSKGWVITVSNPAGVKQGLKELRDLLKDVDCLIDEAGRMARSWGAVDDV